MSETDALEQLEAFVGSWDLEASLPAPPGTDVRARAEFEWVLDRTFLLQRSEISLPEAPDGLMVIAPDGGDDGYTQHYFDSRGVVRTYEMTFDGRVWTLAREKPDFSPLDFSQRFTGTFDHDGKTIRGKWEVCRDGTNWERDFDLTYSKIE